MNIRLLVLAGLGALLLSIGASAQTATYRYTGATWLLFTNFTSCGTGPCANYPPGSDATGQFTTATPLPSNMPVTNVLPLMTSFSFSDGVNTYSSADSGARVGDFSVATGPDGDVVFTGSFNIQLERWQSGSSPRAPGDRVASFRLGLLGGGALNNSACTSVGTAPNGVTDVCAAQAVDSATSSALNLAPGIWSRSLAAVPTPTLSGLSIVLLACLTAVLASQALRERQNAT